ncbi:MAG: DUF3365 domain-containing protein [Candidatus Competibacterales bacterium]
MGLRTKFNLMLLATSGLGLGLAAALGYYLLLATAQEMVVTKARIMMDSALAIRNYTINEVRPLLREIESHERFLPQTVPSYAATTNFDKLRAIYPDYAYKEAALNPTNPRDRATDWESDIIYHFRNNPDNKEYVGVRETPTGPMLHLAHPMQITNEGCLTCHSSPDRAPQAMRALYGDNNGFGWQMGEIIGARVVSVPMSVVLDQAYQTFWAFLGALALVFVLIAVALNIMLHRIVIKPVTSMARIANAVSMGDMDIPEYTKKGKDEIASLSASFNRMRRSLENALKLLD